MADLAMKWRLLQAILSDREATATAKIVAARLLEFHNNRSGQCNPSYGTIAGAVGTDRRTVIRAIAELERYGWLTVIRTGRDQAKDLAKGLPSNSFEFAWHRIESIPPSDIHDTSPSDNPDTSPSVMDVTTLVTEMSDPSVTSVTTLVSPVSPKPTKNNQRIETTNKNTDSRPPSASRRHVERGCEDSFPEFYRQYPKRVGRLAAEKAYLSVIRNGKATHEELLQGAMRTAEAMAHTEQRYIKAPVVWLNQGCWMDEIAPDDSRGLSMSEISLGKHRQRKTFGDLCHEYPLDGRPTGGAASAIEGIFSRIPEDDQ